MSLLPRIPKRPGRLAALLAISSLITALPVLGQATPAAAPAPSTNPPLVSAEEFAGPIEIGDVLNVVVLNQDSLSGPQRVDADGTITLPLAGQVKVLGLMPAAASRALSKHLVDRQLIKNPQVAVYITGRLKRAVRIAGAVQTQGEVNIKKNSLLNEVLEPAGIRPDSDISKVVITRDGKPITINYQLYREGKQEGAEVNPPLLDGDRIFVYVREVPAGTVYVGGEVKTAQNITTTSDTTVGQALAVAGGITELADRDNIFIQRGDEKIKVDFKAIFERGDKSADIVLKDKDRIVVPKLEKQKTFAVMGAVNAPGPYQIHTKMTLLDAIAAARGTTDGAREREIELIRTDPTSGKATTKKVSLAEAKDANMEVMEGDYIKVPFARNRPGLNAFSILGALGSAFWLFR